MYCSNCGKELRENAKFCSFCGTTIASQEKNEAVVAEEAEKDNVTTAENIITEEAEAENTTAEEKITEKENDNIAEEAVKSEAFEEKHEFEEKFHQQDDLFIVNEQPAVVENPYTEFTEITEKKKTPWIKITIAAVCIALGGAAAYFVPTNVIPAVKYSNAEKLYANGDFTAASAAFAELESYKESTDYIMKCRYGEAEKLFTDGNYLEAADAFTALDGYSDADSRAAECMIAMAEKYIAEGNYDSAMSIYAAAGKPELAEQTALKKIEALAAGGKYFEAAEIAENYCSEDIVKEYLYQGALSAKASGDFKTAADTFYKIGKYKDSANHAEECTYSFYISEYSQKGASEEIVRGFYYLGNFRNSHDMFIEASYEYGFTCQENGDFASAVAMFKNCGNYKAAIGELYKARYNLGKTLLDSDPASARSIFALLSTYSDSAAQKKAAASRLPNNHENWYADGFTSAGNYYTTVFRNTDTLIISCTAGTETISSPVTLTLTLRDSDGNEVTADCENVRNSGSFNGSFSLSSAATGDAEIIIARKDNGALLRTIDITIAE